MKKGFRNVLGGITTKTESNFEKKFTRHHVADRLDTDRGIVVKVNDAGDTYNIRLYRTNSIIEYIPPLNPPDLPYPINAEVILGHGKGRRQQVGIIGRFSYQYPPATGG